MTRRISTFVLFGVLFAAATASAGTINVPAGGDLQAALNQAQPGDTILLAAGATYTGNFVLPAKSGTGYITIRSNAPDASLPAAGQRITPAYASYLPKLQAPANAGGVAPLSTAPYASYYIIQFIEFLPNPSGVGALLALGSADSTQNTLAVVPHDLIVDRCYLHSYPGVPQLRGIALNSASTTIENSYISEIKAAGSDAQAIAGWNGPGPFKILNNYLEAAAENFLIGGSSMFIPNVTPTGIEFRNNYVTKQLAWQGSQWVVKNLFELKHAQDVTVDGNIFEYNWVAAQPGYSILFTPRNQYKDNPWTVVQRVTFSNNIVRHVSSAVNILGWDNESSNQNIQTNHITIRNNVFEDVNSATWGGDGRLLQISETPYVALDHNTVFNSGSAVYAYNTTDPNFVFTNNIVNTASYGISGASTGGNATTAISMYFPGSSFLDNLFVACPSTGTYPAGNYFPASYSAVGFINQSGGDYHLASSSPYKYQGTDAKDPGADIDALAAAQASSTSTKTPPPPSDSAPTVSLTAPTSGASYAAGATIALSASASDSDSTPVSRVDFYANGTLLGSATASPYSFSWAGVAAGSYSVTAVATDSGGLSTQSGAVSITVTSSTGGGSAAGLPSGWTDGDVGAVGLPGTASAAGGTFTVNGAGADIWGTADSFNYVYQPLAGDGQIVARVASLQNTNTYAKAGVMLRETLGAGSSEVTVDVKPAGGIEFLSRLTTGGSTTCVGSSANAPVWVKIVRAGTTVTGYFSADGTTWTKAGSVTVTMATNVYVGLAVTSHNTAAINTATFDSVAVTPATPAPAPAGPTLTDADVGSVGMPGSMSVSGGTYTIKGAGADIWGTTDAFNFAYQSLAGDGQVVTRVASLQNTNTYAKAGVMIRETLTAGSRHALLDVKPGGGLEFLTRTSTGGTTSAISATGSAPVWLKLVRAGTTITAYSSADGKTWTTVGSATVSMASSVYVGLVVCSHTTAALNTATFDNVAIGTASAATTTTPLPYTDSDVGAVGLAGSASFSNGVYTVKGAGADVWGTADAFNFAYVPLNGNGQIVARVASVQNTNSYAKAGIMIRETTAANASGVTLDVKPGGGVEFLARTSTGGSTSYVAGTTGSAPIWLKLVRSGTTITGYTSPDGATWTAVANVTVSMATNVSIGLGVCSHITGTLNTSTFDNVSVQ